MASKITIKRSTSALPPAGLSFGELAFVQGTGITANQLYVGISGASPVWVGAQISTTGSWTDNAAKTSLATQYAIDQRISSQISGGSPITTVSDNTNTTRYLVLSTSAAAGVTLFVDDTTGPLSYNPSTGTLGLNGSMELGHATDTTIARVSAGVVSIEGVNIVTTSSTDTLTNKNFDTGGTGNVFRIAGTQISANTGSGSNVLATSPTLVTPTLGVASATTINKVTLTAPATGSTITVADGKTLTASNTLTFTGTDASSVAFGAGGTVVYTSGLGTNVATFLATPSSANLASALTDETGSGSGGVLVFGTSPAITTSLTTPSASFDLLNTAATTINFAGGASTALNIGNASSNATFAGNVVVNGNLTVQGDTTTLNTTTLNVEDFNITMGLTLTSASLCTGAGIGIGVGTGITFAYNHPTTSWLSSVDLDLASAKVYKIGGTSVLSSSALGSGVTGSSLTQVGTITSGTWNSSFAAGLIVNADINNFAAISDAKLATIATIGKVSNSATTATSVAGNSTIVARDASGNFAAGTITANLTGTASQATSATTATNMNVTEQTTGTMFLVGVAAAGFTASLLVNAVPSTALTYDVVTGELSATLIDGGSF
jgi:hypothetical protein